MTQSGKTRHNGDSQPAQDGLQGQLISAPTRSPMKIGEYALFLISQAFSELGDQLWALGLKNFFFENSPWTPAAGLAALFVVQAIPLFLFAPWLTQGIGQRWRGVALAADAGRMAVTLAFAVFLWVSDRPDTPAEIIVPLLAVQFLLELGSLVFQNCRNCLVPVLFHNPADISRAHLWANVASLSAAGIVPLIFLLAMPAGQKIRVDWLMWAAFIDAITFAVSGIALLALKNSAKLKEQMPATLSAQPGSGSFAAQLRQGIATAQKYPAVMSVLKYSFVYNLLLMGPVEIGLVTFLRRDLALPPVSLAVNLLLFLCGIIAGTFAANFFWKHADARHMKRFSYSVFWDGITFFPVCLFALFQKSLSEHFFLAGLCFLFFAHYTLVPFVKVSRLAAIQTLSERSDWSTLLGFHAIAVEGAAAVSVVAVAMIMPDLNGVTLLALGGAGATLCGIMGIYRLVGSPARPPHEFVFSRAADDSDKGKNSP
ncbi:MAG: hypothetical protein EBR09_14080 [Proteobacteria bacterium]|nr:hypothetical protein [Pseudomonadota bacterium]